MNCKRVLSQRSQFFHNRLFLSNHAKRRSTIQRLGITWKVCNGSVAITRCCKILRTKFRKRTVAKLTKTKTDRRTLPAGIARVLKRLHYPLDVILLRVRWYVAYSLSLRNLEEMIAERGFEVHHSTVHRWVIKLVPLFEKAFRKHKRPVGKSWRMDETYVKVKGEWKYLYRAVDKEGKTVDFLLRAHREAMSS
jgi:hypothetical protein